MSIRINRVYTRSGDAGETGLVGGSRVHKSDLRVCVYGEIDELNSSLGCVRDSLSKKTEELASLLETIQQELFDIGSEVATPSDDNYEGMYKTTEKEVTSLEKLCDRFSEGLPDLQSFILPGGSPTASSLHLARCVCRRAEREAWKLKEKEELNPEILKYLNRLSDLLFILSRYVLKKEGKKEILWVQAKDRIAG